MDAINSIFYSVECRFVFLDCDSYSFMDCAVLVMVCHLPLEGTMTILVRKCSLLDGS